MVLLNLCPHRLEETIIFGLIERSQFKHNAIIYDDESHDQRMSKFKLMDGASLSLSFLDYFLLETEKVHAKVR